MQPYLSIVVPSRNDDHGGDLLKRMQIFVTALLEQCRRFQLPAELIIVEWNPPEDRPRLIDALHWPTEPGPCAVRVIEVPESIHRRYAHADGLALYQMIAKNVGIRRAHGEFVLATNIDILLSDELMRFLANRSLNADRMYRIDRSDVSADIPDAPVEEQLAWCHTHLIRVNAAHGTYSPTPDGTMALEAKDIAKPGSGLSFGAGWFAREFSGSEAFRWVDNNAEIFLESSDVGNVLSLDVSPGPSLREEATTLAVVDEYGANVLSTRLTGRKVVNIPLAQGSSRLRIHVEGGGHRMEGEPRPLNLCVRRAQVQKPSALRSAGDGVVQIWRAMGRKILRMFQPAAKYVDINPPFLHLTASGDFTMLARERWLDLRGYPEFDMFAMNLDSLFCWTAHYGGAKEFVLAAPMRAYHIEHATGSGWTPEGHTKLFARLAEKGVPSLDHLEMLRWGFDMCRTNSPIIFNRENWGLAAEELKETHLPE